MQGAEVGRVPLLLESREALRRWVREAGREGATVGFVPTMGALHEGHLTLVREALRRTDRVVVSIFVNPTQFGRGEDLDRYPRDLEGDRRLLSQVGCHALFAPPVSEIYREGGETVVRVGSLGEELCGAFRPGHFQGVATVVAILFNLVRPDTAFFGLKDYQQFIIIRRMARDLGFPLRVEGVETVREADGLAMSSRNRYLSSTEREQAGALWRALTAAREALGRGEDDAGRLREVASRVLAEAGVRRVDYVSLRDAETFSSLERVGSAAVMLIAAYVGSTRLIDNLRLVRP
ncbi:MAG: pantoate--beta-alanine ligase [Magnetococcales bacterium]|nr:pantoate--beta-alanine ligase [Magnetococcales bacterium]